MEVNELKEKLEAAVKTVETDVKSDVVKVETEVKEEVQKVEDFVKKELTDTQKVVVLKASRELLQLENLLHRLSAQVVDIQTRYKNTQTALQTACSDILKEMKADEQKYVVDLDNFFVVLKDSLKV